MATCRLRARVLSPVLSLAEQEHAQIKQLALVGQIDWSTNSGEHGVLVGKFRAEVKDHYYRHQRRRCCYCSTELPRHKLTYDAEHILDKDEYPEYMFDESNIAVACKLCNQHKSNKSVAVGGKRFAELSRSSEHYSIVHPHLDEWFDHLAFDSVGRIVSTGSAKGDETISVCGMAALNAVRLADEFDIDDAPQAEEALRAFHEVKDPIRRGKLLELLEQLSQKSEFPGSQAVIEALKLDLTSTPAVAALAAPGPQASTSLAVHDSAYAAFAQSKGARKANQAAALAPLLLLGAPAVAQDAGPDENDAR